ncbi:MAG: hypothetical protein ACPG8Q_05490, partial [Candidatus Poseidoniaceae archaeon]
LRPLHRSFGILLFIQALDVFIHVASGQVESLRISASVMLVIAAWMILASPGGAKGVGIANAFAFMVLNGVFLSVSGLSNPETGSLRVPLFVLVTLSLVAFAYHVLLAQASVRD